MTDSAYTGVLANLPVHDVAAAGPWYERLFGRPPDRNPMPGLLEWQLTAGGGVQVAQSDGARTGTATLTVDDLDALVADLRSRDVEVETPTTGTGARFVQLSDPAGNTIVLAEAPPDGS